MIENSYWPRFDEQRINIKALWNDIAGDVVKEKDLFYLATFDWTKGEKTLNFLSDEGVNNGLALNELIQGIEKPKNDGRKHQSTEIYAALREGISFLQQQKQSDSSAYAIVLFSSEFNNIFNNSQTKSDVIVEARKAGIPIYTVRYSYSDKYDLKDVSNATYGKHFIRNELSNEAIKNGINGIKNDVQGTDYSLTFSSLFPANSDFRTVKLQLSNEDEISLNYQSPNRWLFLWKNPIYRFSSILILILVLTLLIWTIKLQKKKRLQEKLALEKIKEDTEKSIQESEHQQATKEAERELILKQEQLQKLEEELTKAFRQLPRRPTLVAQNGETFEITSPFFTIGRSEQCSLQLDNPTLSKKHAGIYFNCLPNELVATNTRNFYLVDLDSTNGTLLNTKRALTIHAPHENHQQVSVLNNNDLIQLGELSFTFLV
ncbi:MAG: FHA domain-containing protein [Crocinitomicaceae bacterium]|nr:FHA domain-containing protein [Crocinitomicaceae bacterium]